MGEEKKEEKILLPHHEQQKLCVTRLAYRQGRKLTAVKVYSVTKESNHLLIFGVPSLNLRQEIKTHFIKFGKLMQFNVSKDHAAESFTETYHAQYERIQSARIAKRVLDTKNFYGGVLHVCYAPEMETISETQQKLLQRQKDVLSRLRNLNNEETKPREATASKSANTVVVSRDNVKNNLLNMGEINIINCGNEHTKCKRKIYNDVVIEKRFKPCFIDQNLDDKDVIVNEITTEEDNDRSDNEKIDSKLASYNVEKHTSVASEIEIVDCTSVDGAIVSNISEALNYKKFGEENVYKVTAKPINRIKFNVNKKSLIYSMFYFTILKNVDT